MKCKKRYKDMVKYAEYKRRSVRNYDQKTRFFRDETYRKRYSKKEVIMILKHDIPDRELAKLLGRSVRCIQIKRSKLKKEKMVA